MVRMYTIIALLTLLPAAAPLPACNMERLNARVPQRACRIQLTGLHAALGCPPSDPSHCVRTRDVAPGTLPHVV